MKNRLFLYCILLFLFFINNRTLASTEVPDAQPLSPYILTENSDDPTDQVSLESTDVEVNINGSIAEVRVKQCFRNNGDSMTSGRYLFPVPKRASVHSMQMKTGEKIFSAIVKEQKTARKEFNRFKEEGKNALLIEKDRPNLFSMNLVNIMPGDTVETELSYTELLIPTDRKYQFVFPAAAESAHPDSDFNIEVNISAGIPIQELVCTTHDTATIFENRSSAKVILKDPDKKGNNRDYILNYRLAEQKMPSGLILSGGEDEKFLLLNEYVSSSALKNVSVKFTGFETYDLEPSIIPALFARRPVTLLGKWKGEADGLIRVEGKMNRRNYSKTFRFVKNNSRKSNGALEHLWAEKRIGRLSGFNTDNGNRDINSEITNLGLKYNLLTENTSFIAFNDVVRKAEPPETPGVPAQILKEPSPVPKGETKLAAVESRKVPEPGLYILMLIMASVLFTGNIRRKAVMIFSRSHLR